MADPTLNPENVRAWLKGEVFVSPAGTAVPTSPTDELAVGWRSLGVLDQEAGASESESENTTSVYGWGISKVRDLKNQYAISLTVVALESNPVVENLLNPEHGATHNAGVTTWKKKAPTHVPVQMLLRTADGPITEVIVAKRADASVSAETMRGETNVRKRTITFDLYAESDGAFFTTLSDDGAMAPLASM